MNLPRPMGTGLLMLMSFSIGLIRGESIEKNIAPASYWILGLLTILIFGLLHVMEIDLLSYKIKEAIK